MSCSCFIMKTCQLFSWPGVGGRIRFRIRPKSFRIHNTVFAKCAMCMHVVSAKRLKGILFVTSNIVFFKLSDQTRPYPVPVLRAPKNLT
jgi:hypothetical protein